MQYYKEEINKILKTLETKTEGLTSAEARKRKEKFGENKLKTEKKIKPLKIFINQFRSFIIYLLFIAVFLSLVIGQLVNSLLIFGILILNAILGFFQEYSTQKSLKALQKLNYIKANVYRDKKIHHIDSKSLVPGDIIYLEAGDIVPADCRLIKINRLEVEESCLTGESKPVKKHTEKIKTEVDMGDRKNMLFSSTVITKGSGWAVIVKTGMDTEIGKITAMVKDVEEEQTPLQKRLENFGKKLSYAILLICLIIFVMLLYTHEFSFENLNKFALIALSLAVAAVPTVLPSVVTIAQSVGVNRLLKKNALVRNLASVETLGSCDVICTDKTGTLTKNEMTVIKACTFDSETDIEGVGYSTNGKINTKTNPLLFRIGDICNNSSVFKKNGKWRISGEPTEAALKVSSHKAKINTSKIQKLDELPFDSNRKMMSVLAKDGTKKIMYTKGAPDEILKKAKYYISNGKVYNLTKKKKELLLNKNIEYAKEGLRVLAFAYKEIKNKTDFKEESLIVVGLQAMEDPPRPDVIESFKKTEEAGIRVIMITGDFKETAQAIATHIGIKGNILEGKELRNMNDKELHKALMNNYNIFARAIPEDKQRIVRLLQKEDHVVAMTGDGVNDAPALKKANIGVAVGTGTDVAKEASDFVLLDDSFSNIVNAVEEGRGIYDNIQKSITLLLSGNFSEILVIFFAIILGWNLPLTAIFLLWINLVANGAPAIAFTVDPYDSQIMKRKPLNSKMGILPKDKLSLIAFVGVAGSSLSLLLFSQFGGNAAMGTEDLMLAQTMVFNFIVVYELLHVFMIRDEYNVKFFTNKWLWASIAFSLGLQATILYSPAHQYFSMIPLSIGQLQVLGAALATFMIIHMIYNRFAKWYFRSYYYA